MAESQISRRDFVRNSALAAAGVATGMAAGKAAAADTSKILNYNADMEYRQLGRTGMMVSAVCMGGHWKRVDLMVPGIFKGKGWLSARLDDKDFEKNRRDVVTRLIERGINYIDACTWQEVVTYAKALRGRRDKMHLGFSWYQEEMRKPNFRTCKALLGTLDKGMKEAGLEYVDVWRITMLSKSGKHTEGEVEEMMMALDKAKEQGKARFTGLSSHDRPHIKWMIEKYPKQVDVVCTPYTAGSKVLPKDSVFDAAKKYEVGMFGIKPFGGNSLFKGNSALDSSQAEADDRRARLAIRYILCNPALTAPIPGLINTHQVDNMARAIKERLELDLAHAELEELKQATDEMWARLPKHYEWLRDWEYV